MSKKVETFLAWSDAERSRLLSWHQRSFLPRAAACLWPDSEEGPRGASLGLSSKMTGQALKEVNPSSKEERRPQNSFFLSQPDTVTT